MSITPKEKKPEMENNDSITFACNGEMKIDFFTAVHKNDGDLSKVLRAFVKMYLTEHAGKVKQPKSNFLKEIKNGK